MELSIEQQLAIDKFREGHNIFLTGPGGTGKTEIIKNIKQIAEDNNKHIQVCALTGCAAVLLQCKAKTVHSWAGIGLANGSIESIVDSIMNNKYKLKKWLWIDILIIDEVSMMSKKIFELLDTIGKTVKKNSKPFGGIQLVFSGDFYQLPPVGKTQEFCFESSLWGETFKYHIQLTKIFRQTDIVFINILNEIREGALSKENKKILKQQLNKKIDNEIIKPTKILPTRSKVEYINTHELNSLIGEEYSYENKNILDLPMTGKEKIIRKNFSNEQINSELQYIQNNLICDKLIKLKVGAQVMFVVNNDLLCNGSQGIITSFEDNIPIVKFTNGLEILIGNYTWLSENIPGIGVSQIPLILAWAITIHKSQGSTMDYVELDIGSTIFECGQTYVALSRVKSLSGLFLSYFNHHKIKVNQKVKEFYNNI